MENSREFILFIPGIGAKEPGQALKKLVEGINSQCSHNIDVKELEQGQYQIEVTANNFIKVIDIKEVYWGDLLPRLSSESGVRKVLGGFDLLLYWTIFAFGRKKFFTTVWKSKYILFSLIVTLLLSLAWYYGVLAAAFTAIGTNPEVFSQQLPSQIAEWFKSIGSFMGGGQVWVAASTITYFVPVSQAIDISYASKCYLENYKNVSDKVHARSNKTLEKFSQSSKYDRITVVAHSFGVVVATEVLAKYKGGSNAQNIDLVTLGGPLLLINARSKRVEDAVTEMLGNEKIESWNDFYSSNDWLCTRFPLQNNKFTGQKIPGTIALQDKFKGISHDLYFETRIVVETLLKLKVD